MGCKLPQAVATERLRLIKGWMRQGITQVEMASCLRLTQPAVSAFMKRHGLARTSPANVSAAQRAAQWGKERADPSTLTPDQRAHAARIGIEPGRYAWLMTCPKTGNAKGWRGGASIG
jgi:transcriptional regulator